MFYVTYENEKIIFTIANNYISVCPAKLSFSHIYIFSIFWESEGDSNTRWTKKQDVGGLQNSGNILARGVCEPEFAPRMIPCKID